ncbi:hypothetical protein KR009_007023 [Drosophila setifemur]|nr:hypothetical protein KR009_007023 [Drosophila setifemur]
MPLEGLCIELRPNLRSGVVFLQFNHDIGARNETRLVIREHNVYIAEGPARSTPTSGSDYSKEEVEATDTLVIRHDCFGMDIGCISVFVVTKNHISFRFNYTQIDLDALDGGSVQVALAPLLLSCRENEPFAVTCRNCRAELVGERCYRRLREFPSCVVDPGEFFCHNHGPGCDSKPPSLVPAETDLFYGLNYVVVSWNPANPNMLCREDHLYCRRCMRFLGLAMFNGAAARLWADAVCWLGSVSVTEAVPRHLFKSSTLTQLVKRLLHSMWPQPLPQLCLSTSRAALVTSLPSRCHRYLLIHVVESQLRVLRRIRPNSNQLRCYRACKLYFGLFGSSNQEQPELMQQWQTKQTLPQMEISPDMFQALLERLELNAQLIPYAWRHKSPDQQLQLSYFFYENEDEPSSPEVGVEDNACSFTFSKIQLEDQYETDAGHASESDDEHSDTDSDTCHSAGRRSIKRCPPTPPRSCLNLSTSSSSSSSASSEGK